MGGTIRLGGIDYPLVAGAYARFDATGGPTQTAGRQTVSRFDGGQRQAVAGDPARSWDGVGVRAVYGGLGVEPWPAESSYFDSGMEGVTAGKASTTRRAQPAAAGNNVYVAIGRWLFKTVGMGAGSWAAFTQVADFGSGEQVTELFPTDGDDLIVGLGTGSDARLFNTTSESHTAWRAGEKVVAGVAYGGQVLYAPKSAGGSGGKFGRLRLSLTRYDGTATVDERYLDANIVRFALHRGAVAIATRRSLFLFGGQPQPGRADDAGISGDQSQPTIWRGDPEPVFSHGEYTTSDDFVFLLSFRGRLWTWLSGHVASWDGTASGWTEEPIAGLTCWGAAVAGGYLVVAVERVDGTKEVWAYDGSGWWRVATHGSAAARRLWPVALYGAGSWDCLVFEEAASAYERYRFAARSAANQAFKSAGEWVSSLLDAGSPAEAKRWERVGATFAAPEGRGNAASVDSVTLRLSYSIDAGATWTEADSATVGIAAGRAVELSAELAGVEARYVQLKVSWESVSDWAPVLQAAWADWTVLTVPARKRRWELAVRCSDLAVDDAGHPWPAAGDAIAAALWAAWEGGAALPFRDLDYPADPSERTVRIGHIAETVERGGDRARWGETRVRLLLVEQ